MSIEEEQLALSDMNANEIPDSNTVPLHGPFPTLQSYPSHGTVSSNNHQFPQGSATSDAYPPPRFRHIQPRPEANSSTYQTSPELVTLTPLFDSGTYSRATGGGTHHPLPQYLTSFHYTPASLPQQPADPFIPWPVPHSQPVYVYPNQNDMMEFLSDPGYADVITEANKFVKV
ncbi:hypothetical protein FB45DRAFT_1028844 [Roridomyces roridus]|uniref:Uncharacterized protein n=1 Tax=Roridomyces roridus TaxID=1738132 RepID=A0AAD7BRV2_9AGAR|nr:hypothetical protein FB45DRAFT_1028844 [Roridomyces roridus]